MSKSKKNKAVALKYNANEDVAPIVIASGYGKTADKIIDIAEQRGIPVFRDDSAASLMCMLEVGANVPQELYQVVAAIYVEIMKTSAQIKGQTPPDDIVPRRRKKSVLDESKSRRRARDDKNNNQDRPKETENIIKQASPFEDISVDWSFDDTIF